MAPERSEEEQSEKGFTVSDKRMFTKEGQRKTSAEPGDTPPASTPPPRREAPRREESRRPRETSAGEAPPHDLPPADFSTYVSMLAHSVMICLGQIPDPMSQQRHRDLPQARHTIDILLMLREKTQGNLTAEEAQLMQELLPQLQMAYVATSRQGG
jgi:hypothetical protein